jgi:hypothetical protein
VETPPDNNEKSSETPTMLDSNASIKGRSSTTCNFMQIRPFFCATSSCFRPRVGRKHHGECRKLAGNLQLPTSSTRSKVNTTGLPFESFLLRTASSVALSAAFQIDGDCITMQRLRVSLDDVYTRFLRKIQSNCASHCDWRHL